MRIKYFNLLFTLLPFTAPAQLRTGTAPLTIGDNTSLMVPGKVILAADIAGNGNLVLYGTTVRADVDAGGMKIPNLVINSTKGVRMINDASVTNTLLFTKGKIFTNNSLLTLLPAATITGYSSAQYICTADTLGNDASAGGLQLPVSAGASFLAPVGPFAYYNPVTITNASGPGEQYTVRVNAAAVPGPTAANTLNTTWNITEATAGGNIIALTLQWDVASEPVGFNRSAARIVRSNGISDVEKTTVLSATGSGPYIITGGAFTGTSLFGVSSAANALIANAISKGTDEGLLVIKENISMYPTVVTGYNAQLVIAAPAEKKYQYIISDINGRVFAKKDIPVLKGVNTIPVNLPALANGMYILNVYDGAVLKKSIKFVKG